jgi:hypothetical protein
MTDPRTPDPPGGADPTERILRAWIELEEALRDALPTCSVQPPTQPGELLSALRINREIGPDEEARIQGLREARNRAAHGIRDVTPAEADRFEEEVAALAARLKGGAV